MQRKVIALEMRLRQCRNVQTLGLRTNFLDYPPQHQQLIRQAPKIYYPTTFYADLFDSIGKSIFPSYHTYKCVQDKIRQTALFHLKQIPHPRTQVFYGGTDKKVSKILKQFRFPFIAKVPRGSALGRGVYLIENREQLETYCHANKVAYIQQYLPIKKDIRVVVIGEKVIHAYWRKAPSGDFRTNVASGGTVCLDPVPQPAIDLALHVAKALNWNDVGMDICQHDHQFYILEANMKYGKAGFRAAGMDYYRIMEELIENGDI